MNLAVKQTENSGPLEQREMTAEELRPVIAEVNYHLAWQAFALRHFLALFLMYSWLPVVIGLFILSRTRIHRPLESLGVMAVWLVAAGAAVWWAGQFRCPRCRRRYGALGSKKGSTNLTRGIFDRVCNNCKLRKFEHG